MARMGPPCDEDDEIGGGGPVTIDAVSENVAAADPQSYSHAGGAAPRGVLIFVAKDGTANSSADIVAEVSYGALSMGAAIQSNTDADTEATRTSIYFKGADIPVGTQTVTVDRTEGTTNLHITCVTLNGSRDLEVIDSDGLDTTGARANPQVTLQFNNRNAMSFCVLASGHSTVASLTSLAGHTRVHDHDFGAFVSAVDRLTVSQTIDDVIGYVAATEDAAFSACAVAEV